MRIVLLLLFIVGTVVRANAGNWPSWRGPESNGVAPDGKYAVEWSKTDNIAWKVKLDGRGASTPIVWGDRIFLTFGRNGENVVQALDRNGKTLWDVAVGKERPGKNQKASGSNPSVVTDGQFVFAYFKSGDLACVDFRGNVVWHKNLQDQFGEDTLWWDLGTSPVLTERNVVVACMQTGPSYLVAFDKASGKQHWKADRNLDAPEEAAQSYSTPIVVSDGGDETIYVLGADHVTAHDAQNGKELWRVGGLNPTSHKYFRSIASPVLADGLLIAPYARGQSITAIRLGGRGDVTKSHVAWTREGIGADVPTPVAAVGKVYVCTDNGRVACLDAQSGKTLHDVQLEKHRMAFSSSPVLANGKLYVTREDGTTFVLDTAKALEQVAKNSLEEQTVATPSFVDDRIYLRTYDHLYCIGK